MSNYRWKLKTPKVRFKIWIALGSIHNQIIEKIEKNLIENLDF